MDYTRLWKMPTVPKPDDTSKLLDKRGEQQVQSVVGSFLCYDPTC